MLEIINGEVVYLGRAIFWQGNRGHGKLPPRRNYIDSKSIAPGELINLSRLKSSLLLDGNIWKKSGEGIHPSSLWCTRFDGPFFKSSWLVQILSESCNFSVETSHIYISTTIFHYRWGMWNSCTSTADGAHCWWRDCTKGCMAMASTTFRLGKLFYLRRNIGWTTSRHFRRTLFPGKNVSFQKVLIKFILKQGKNCEKLFIES